MWHTEDQTDTIRHNKAVWGDTQADTDTTQTQEHAKQQGCSERSKRERGGDRQARWESEKYPHKHQEDSLSNSDEEGGSFAEIRWERNQDFHDVFNSRDVLFEVSSCHLVPFSSSPPPPSSLVTINDPRKPAGKGPGKEPEETSW